MKKALFYLLLLLNFLLPLCIMSNSIDGDFGFHLRFGQQLHSGQPFPYLDSYTYTFYGKPWTNHEWGSDYLIWLVYNYIGYWWLNVIGALAIVFSFLIIGKTFYKKITPLYLAVALFCEYFIEQIFVARPTMLAPLFFAILVYFLEKSKQNYRWLFVLPPLIWIWSLLHGSWILAFIVINIYLGADILTKIIPNKFKKYFYDDGRDKKWIITLISSQVFAALLVAINPYGLNIYKEVYEYFGQSFYKQHVGEWIPSYTFPVFWGILTAQTIALVFLIYGFLKKKINLSQVLLFCAIFYASIMYKRQAVFIALLSAPILAQTIYLASVEFKKIKLFKDGFVGKILLAFLLPTLVFLALHYIDYTHYTKDCWNDNEIIDGSNFSSEGILWLKNNAEHNSRIFSEFAWASMLNWEAKQAYVYFDGRGTATWMYDQKTSMLEHYYKMLDDKNSLSELESLGTNYIILRQPNFAPFAKPDFINNALFGSQIAGLSIFQPNQLQKSLDASKNWTKVFTSFRANIWKRTNLGQ